MNLKIESELPIPVTNRIVEELQGVIDRSLKEINKIAHLDSKIPPHRFDAVLVSIYLNSLVKEPDIKEPNMFDIITYQVEGTFYIHEKKLGKVVEFSKHGKGFCNTFEPIVVTEAMVALQAEESLDALEHVYSRLSKDITSLYDEGGT